jgi:CRISPR-associated protein Cas2
MIVLTMTDCPARLRGDISKWLLEINAGVFVGKVSARVRDRLWERVAEYAKNGRATMVYSANNEQGLDFKVHCSDWAPIDFDGLKLILRPNLSRAGRQYDARPPGYSKASKYRAISRAQKKRAAAAAPARSYVALDLETTGLKADRAEIFAIAALRVENGKVCGEFKALVRIKNAIPQNISELTGISAQALERDGVDLPSAMRSLLAFIGDLPLVAHNVSFDMSFLHAACQRCALAEIENELIDTLALARQFLPELHSHTLQSLSAHFGMENLQAHRAGADCRMAQQLYEQLIKFDKSE